jgi:hypothetical protein
LKEAKAGSNSYDVKIVTLEEVISLATEGINVSPSEPISG